MICLGAQGDNTPLHWASMRGHVEIVRLLLESGADRSIRNKQDKVRRHLLFSFAKEAAGEFERCHSCADGSLHLGHHVPLPDRPLVEHRSTPQPLGDEPTVDRCGLQVALDLAQPCWSHSYRYTREVLAN